MGGHHDVARRTRSLLLFFLLACDGTIDAPGGDPSVPPIVGGGTPPICEGQACRDVDEEPVPASRIPRLTHRQWEKTVRDLFRLDEEPGLANEFDPDVASNGDFTTAHRRLFVSAGLWQDYQRAAERLAADMTSGGTPSRWAPGGTLDRDTLIRDFGLRAYRRPINESERARFEALYAEGSIHYPSLSPQAAGARMLIEAMLQSPHFVYRVELSDGGGETVELSPFELASRLSYLLWGSMPDDALLAAAAAGELNEEGLRTQALRLLDDPRSTPMFEAFHDEHFGMADWADVTKEEAVFTDWQQGLGTAMRAESHALLDSVIRRDEGFTEFLTSRRAFVDEDLARIYGVDGVSGETPQEVTLPDNRAGLLTRLGFLTRWSAQRDPDPIHRGLFVNVNVMCRDVPEAPPVDLASLEFEGTTNRERIASVTHEGACRSCHFALINPPGFALESFDAIGKFRTTDNGAPVDTATTFGFADGTQAAVDGGVELSEAVARNRASHACYASHMLEFAFGRPVSGQDEPLIYRMAEDSLSGELSVRGMVLELVTSRTFRLRTSAELGEAG